MDPIDRAQASGDVVVPIEDDKVHQLEEAIGEIAKERFSLFGETLKCLIVVPLVFAATLALVIPVAVITTIFCVCLGLAYLVRKAASSPNLVEKAKKCEDLFRSMIREMPCVLLIALSSAVNMEWFEPTEKRDAKPQLFVHGYLGNSGNWFWPWLSARIGRKFQQEKKETNHFFLNFGHPFQGIRDDYVPNLHEKVKQVARVSGRLPEFNCHSMGGRVVLDWWIWLHQKPERMNELGVEIPEKIQMHTLGTPFAGTELGIARFAAVFSQAAKEMLPENSTKKAFHDYYDGDGHLCVDEAIAKIELTSHVSMVDLVVRPAASSTGNHLLQAKSIHYYNHHNHVALLFTKQISAQF